MKRIAVFASGAGTNAKILIEHFDLTTGSGRQNGEVTLLVSNRAEAGALKIAQDHGVETLILSKESFFSEQSIVDELKERGIDFIVLAGFLWLIPQALIKAFPNRIINIHPALLPKFGGKGMYGKKVHEVVLAAREKESGITVHYVNEKFDEGEHIAQFKCEVNADDTCDSLAARIQSLEHRHFAVVVEKLLR